PKSQSSLPWSPSFYPASWVTESAGRRESRGQLVDGGHGSAGRRGSRGQPVEAPGRRLQREDLHAAETGILGIDAQSGGEHHGPRGRRAGVAHGSGQARHHAPAVVVALQVGGGGGELVFDQL